MSERESLCPARRIEGLRNLRKGYDTTSAAVGYWKSLHGEDIIEEYAKLAENVEKALWYVKQAVDSLGYDPFKDDKQHREFIEEHGTAAAYLMSAQSTLEWATKE